MSECSSDYIAKVIVSVVRANYCLLISLIAIKRNKKYDKFCIIDSELTKINIHFYTGWKRVAVAVVRKK